ncbi:hypothetical protein HDC36_004403 [Xanthomonas sp. JAI131]|jgi:hypothetical protein|uniref:hypothetical protein n=1 Tax=Xanthomonas sp. JAI131 TaxID=2723067 RepID=UPI0015CC7882|nr:hypothetical protein [Xanthomonas sp. JAI131]NYF22913.1 hypothetical protein [Xanthomonas sp. JAI131]
MVEGPAEVDRSTYTFFSDSIELAYRSAVTKDLDHSNSMARYSLLATAHFIEASANACIESLSLGNGFASDIDKLPFLSKFDLFCRLRRRGASIDRARHEVQQVVEIKRVRDLFVHPKAQAVIWEHWSEDESTARCPRTPALDLPKTPSFCCADDSVNALRACHNFMAYVFQALCKSSKTTASTILFCEDPGFDQSKTVYGCLSKEIHLWLSSNAISIKYIQVY